MAKPIRVSPEKKRASQFSILAVLCFLSGIVFFVMSFVVSISSLSSSPPIIDGSASSATEPQPSSTAESASRSDSLPAAAAAYHENNEKKPSSQEPSDSPPPFSVPESKAQPLSYLDDAVFLGDSITEGMDLYNQSGATIIAYKGLSTVGAMDHPLEKYGNQTALTAVTEAKAKKIYIMLGSNEIAGVRLETYLSRYGKLIDALKAQNPGSIIYLQSLMPVSAKYEKDGNLLTNEAIDKANAVLPNLAKEKGVYFLDTHSALAGSDGKLPDALSPKDGCHFGKAGFEDWFAYLLTHTAP